MNKKSILYKTLARALSLKRPHGGATVAGFTQWLVARLPDLAEVFTDAAGNVHIDMRSSDDHRTLFVAHVDTVHKDEGANKFRKTQYKWYADGSQLGADDGAGCAMLMHLMHSGVPGYYIFTQGEERGGIGAKHIANTYADLLGQFQRAIAFDRRGVDSVITHQGWGRCCSDVFGQALADALNVDERLMYMPDDTGVYTDTAEFTDIIPECTNISVGYDFEHSDKEELDVYHFDLLAQRCALLDWDGLPADRDPTVPDPTMGRYDTGWSKGWWAKYDKGADKYDYADMVADSFSEAIEEARAGYPEYLLDLIAEAAYPEDVDLALRFLDKRRVTKDVVDEIERMAQAYDPDTALLNAFDTLYAEA